MAYNHSQYTATYTKNNYDQVMVKVPKGKREVLKQFAESHRIVDHKGQVSVNRMIIDAIEAQYGIDLSKTE